MYSVLCVVSVGKEVVLWVTVGVYVKRKRNVIPVLVVKSEKAWLQKPTCAGGASSGVRTCQRGLLGHLVLQNRRRPLGSKERRNAE